MRHGTHNQACRSLLCPGTLPTHLSCISPELCCHRRCQGCQLDAISLDTQQQQQAHKHTHMPARKSSVMQMVAQTACPLYKIHVGVPFW